MGSLLILPILFGLNAYAADIFGYYEGQYFGFVLNNDIQQLQSNKLRIDLAQSPSDKVSFGANFNFLNYNGTLNYNIIDYLPDKVVAEVPPDSVDLYYFAYSDSLFLDNAFVKLSLAKFDITIGKQQISYGSGYAFNPTDVFNYKDELDPTYEQPGKNGIRFDIPLSYRFTLMGIYSPGADWDNSIKMLRLKGGLAHFDFSLTGAHLDWTTNDYLEFTSVRETRTLAGIDLVGELLGMGVWFEGAYNIMEESEDFSEITAGTDYTFEGGFYLMGEYYYNGMGKDKADDYRFNDWMRYIAGENRSLGKHNVFLFGDYIISDFIRIGSSFIVSVSDGSIAAVPQLSWNMFQDVDLTVFGNLYTGGNGGAFGEDMGSGGLARVRVYF